MRLDDEELAKTDIEAYLRRHEQKQLLRFVVIGSVDDGKSTLIGRLLHDSHGIYEDQLSAVKRASAKGATRGEGSGSDIDFSLFTDGLRAEREQGITIDVAYRYFSTATRKFIIADTPGHVQYTRNMATGASTANLALILVDARLGVLAQTRRHAYIASLLGIQHLAVCVNKMDLVGWDQPTYTRIAAEIGAFATRLGIADVTCLPLSALRGDFVVARSPDVKWYDGPTLLEHLERVPVAGDANLKDLRFPLQYVVRPDVNYRGFAAQLASGVVKKGDELLALPSGRRSRVVAIDTYEGEIAEAFAPMSVSLRLADEIDLSRGDMLVHPANPPQVGQAFEAMTVWLSERPLDHGKSYLLKHTTRMVRAEVTQVSEVIDPDTLAPRPAERLALNDIARVTVRCHQPIFFDPYRENRATGAFVLIDSLTNDTVAAGMIIGAAGGARATTGGGQVSAAEREQRLGQRGAVITVGGAELAYLIERVLFDDGRIAAVVPAAAAAAVAGAGLYAIVAAAGTTGVRVDERAVAVPAGATDEAIARAVLAAVQKAQ